MTDKKVKVVEFDQAEMACRIAEAISGLDRPPGKTPFEIIEGLEPFTRGSFIRAADAALRYMTETMSAIGDTEIVYYDKEGRA